MTDYWISFALNELGSVIMCWPCFAFLTLKEGRRAWEVLLYLYLIGLPTAVLKYTSDINSWYYTLLDIHNNIVLLSWIKWSFREKIGKCVAAHMILLGNGLIASSLYMWIWGDITDFLGETSVFAYSMHTVCLIAVSLIMWFLVKRIRLKDWPENKWFYVLVGTVSMNILFLIDSVMEYFKNTGDISFTGAVPFTIFMAECMIAVYIMYRLCIQKEKLDRLANLSALRKHEEENYNHLCRKTERMAKLRHDFKGQLFVARHIASVDYDEGMRMIEELRAQIENEPADRG